MATTEVDDYSPNAVEPDIVEQYEELSDDRTAYEAAFGTTINDHDYMNQYVKHNREMTNSKLNLTPMTKRSDALLSPPTPNSKNIIALKEDESHDIINNKMFNQMQTLNITNSFTQSPSDNICDLPSNSLPIPSPSPKAIHIDTSCESLGTLAAMTQGTHCDIHSIFLHTLYVHSI